jgi:hypothetical protein
MGNTSGHTATEVLRAVPAGAGKGRVVLVTGANSGIGLIAARALAYKGFHVVLCARSKANLAAAEADIKTGAPATGVTLTGLVLDLASFASVRQCAADFKALNIPLHILINNGNHSTTIRAAVRTLQLSVSLPLCCRLPCRAVCCSRYDGSAVLEDGGFVRSSVSGQSFVSLSADSAAAAHHAGE